MSNRRLGSCVLLLTSVLAGALAARTPQATSRPASRGETIVAAMQKQGLVGLSVAWISDGKVGATLSLGYADRERAIRADDATLYRWASISKPITAVAAMQLWEVGKLDLDADVRKLVPEWPEKPWVISPRQLLAHQGGVVHYANGKVVRRERAYAEPHPFADVVKALDMFADSPLVCEPGTKHSYSTHGYILLGAVVQRAGGEPYWEQVRKGIAEPLGMKTFQPDYQWVALANRAVGYKKRPGLPAERSTDTDVSWKLPGGGFLSNIGDLARFGAGLLRGELVASETLDLMWTRARTKDGKLTGYGLGFGVRERGEEIEVAHSGGQEKTSTLLVLRPRQRAGIALMCNTEGADLGELAQQLLGDRGLPPTSRAGK